MLMFLNTTVFCFNFFHQPHMKEGFDNILVFFILNQNKSNHDHGLTKFS